MTFLLWQNRRMAKPWMIDELVHAGAEHLEPAFIAGYDRKAGCDRADGSDPTDDLAELRAHGLSSGATLVDLGAGTGRFALAAAREFARVVAVDVSPAMLHVLRDRAVDAGLANVDCVQAGFITYAHAGPPADGIHTRNALHQLPDFWKALALDRMARMLRPGGVLRIRDLIYDFQPGEAEAVLDDWIDGAVDDPHGGYTGKDFAEHIRTEHSTYRWLFEPMLAAAGFEIVSAEYRRSLYGAYTCIRR